MSRTLLCHARAASRSFSHINRIRALKEGMMKAASDRPARSPFQTQDQHEQLITQIEQEHQRAMELAKTLANERDILQAIMENTRTQLAYFDTQFNFLRVNSAYLQGSKQSSEDLIGRNHFELFPDAENQSIFEKVRDTGHAVEFRARPFTFPDQPERGTTFWDWSLVPIKNGTGQVEGLVLSLLEVTERVLAEQALRKHQEELETRVQDRTRELVKANQVLQVEIEERRRVEELLQLQTTAVEAAANGIIITDRHGNIQWCNQAFLQMTGYLREEVLGKNPRFLNSGKHPPQFHKHLWETILSGKVWFGETINRHKDGSLYTEEQTITPVQNRMGEITHFIAIKQDISERKLAEELIRKNAERAETLLEEIRRLYKSELSQRQLAEALVQAAAALNSSLKLDEVLDLILDQTLRVVPSYGANIMFLDGESARLTSYRGYQDHLKSVAHLQLERIPLTPSLTHMVSTGQSVYVPNTTLDPNWVAFPNMGWLRSYVGVPLRSDDQIIGILNVDSDQPDFFSPGAIRHLEAISTHAALAIQNARLYQDLETYLKQEQAMRSQLIQSEKFSAMGRMIASVTHELNNPLQTIKNCLFLVKQETSPHDQAEEYLNMATTEIQRISNLVMQLREIYRPEKAANLILVEPAQIIEEIHLLITPHLQKQHVYWQQVPTPTKIFVTANRDQLKQVFLNICINAIEAMQPAGGRLTVEALLELQNNRIGVIFKDSGPGITPENMARLFDPFFTTKESGTGLGLSISFEIIKRLGGQIEVESSLGNGSTFTVWLPLAEEKNETQ